MSGASRPATSYIRSRQVQNVPRSAWVVPRRARWKACEWALARPGRVRPRRGSVSAGGGGGRGGGKGGEAVAVGFDEALPAEALAGEPGQVGEPPTLGHPARSSR